VGDVYIYYPFTDGLVRRYDPIEKIYYYPNSTFPSFFIDKLILLEINGILFPSPQYPEILVEHFYGPTWKIPIKALSQNGKNHPDYDYYGNYKYSKLEFLISFVSAQTNILLNPNIKMDEINYFFPPENLEWMKENENLKIKNKLHYKNCI